MASSCVCTSPLAVMTVERLHHCVKVSNSAEFKSILLIMCIDPPESTTNSRSSGFRFDGAGRHLFSEGEKNAALFFSFNFRMLLTSLHAASRAPFQHSHCTFVTILFRPFARLFFNLAMRIRDFSPNLQPLLVL